MNTPVPLWLRLWRGLCDGWMTVSRAIGKVMSFILLTVLWIILFGPYAVVWKLSGLMRKHRPDGSHWQPAMTGDAKQMEYQF